MNCRSVPVFFLAAMLLAGGCARRKPNVLLITLDTTRADRLGCYGCTNAVTPAIDKLAAEGARFENADTVVPITLPAHASLLTGVYPPEHGLRVNFIRSLPEDVPSIAESFQAARYRTGAVTAFTVLDVKYGLDKGFDFYDTPEIDPDIEEKMRTPPQFEHDNVKAPYRRAGDVVDRAIGWLKAAGNRKPWFLWVHFYDPHFPWHWNRGQVGDRFSHPYDAEIAYMDQQLARLLSHLDASGQTPRTIVAAIGDHGESLDEHNEPTHSFFTYQTTIHVPLVIRYPGRIAPDQRIRHPVSIVQLAPTILDLASVPPAPALARFWSGLRWLPPAAHPGVRSDSLVLRENDRFTVPDPDFDRGDADGSLCYSESDYTFESFRWAPLRAIRVGPWKYIRAPRPELYNLADDPGERNNLAEASESNQVARLEQALAELEDLMTPREGQALQMNERDLRIMESMGYVSGGAQPSPRGAGLSALPDPKDVIWAGLWTIKIRKAMDAGDYGDEILALSRDTVRMSPNTARFQHQLAMILDRRGQHAEALDPWNKAVALDPLRSDYWTGKAMCLVNAGRDLEALPCFREAHRLDPGRRETRGNLIHALNTVSRKAANARQFKIADTLIDEGAALEPDNPGWNLSRAGVRLAAGDRGAALGILRKTLEENPHYQPAAEALRQLEAPPAAVQPQKEQP